MTESDLARMTRRELHDLIMVLSAAVNRKHGGLPPGYLTEDEIDTIEAIARNQQSGRITQFEVSQLVETYRAVHFPPKGDSQ